MWVKEPKRNVLAYRTTAIASEAVRPSESVGRSMR